MAELKPPEQGGAKVTSGAEALLKRGNWKMTVEGWAYWAKQYNTLLVEEGKFDDQLRLDIIT